MSTQDAIAKGLPTFNHGEYAYMPLGDCLEKKYICMNGMLQDLGMPPKKSANCNGRVKLDARDVATQLDAKAEDKNQTWLRRKCFHRIRDGQPFTRVQKR